MHLESINLHLMTTEYAHQFILFQEFLDWLLSKVVRAFSLRVVDEVSMLGILILHGVGPHEVAEDPAVLAGLMLETRDRITMAVAETCGLVLPS